jgi:TolB-like protein/Tfp pilus assembly protein PilF
VKILDFGLAKRLAAPEGREEEITAAVTREGATLGTLNYMSPEQLKGQAVDTRSDIFSLGLVLYELLTGVHPFRGESQMQTVGRILQKDPPALDQYMQETPGLLEHTVSKMLAKPADSRYQSIHEVRTNLIKLQQQSGALPAEEPAAVSSQSRFLWVVVLVPLMVIAVWIGWWLFRGEVSSIAPGEISSLAVLPLDNMMKDPEQEYFVEGMHEALTLELSKIRALRVPSRTSATRAADEGEGLLPEIAAELGVDALIEGSVFRSEDGNEVRITVQLVAFGPERHIWSNSYDRALGDILKLYSEVAQAVAGEIKVAVTSEDQARLAANRKVDPEAYDYYLKGRSHWNEWTPAGMEQSEKYFRQSIAIDPDYAPSWAGLSMAIRFPATTGVAPGTERLPLSHEAALKAVELDSTSAEARASLGMGKCLGWNWVECERDFLQALELDPNYAHGHHVYSNLYLVIMGQLDEALKQIKRARELDPFSLPHNVVLGKVQYYRGEYDQAIEQLGATIDLDPGFAVAYLFLGNAYREKGMYEKAIEAQEKATTLSRSPWFLGQLGSTYAMSDRRSEALRIVDELVQRRSSQYVGPLSVARIFTSLGEIDRAFEWLDKAYEEKDLQLPWFFSDPPSEPLRSDPRWEQLLRKLNLPEEVISKHLTGKHAQ